MSRKGKHKRPHTPRPPAPARGSRVVLGGAVVLIAVAAWWGIQTLWTASSPEPPLPEMADIEPRVAATIAELRQTVLDRNDAASWGRLGGTYDAHGLFDAAELCYAEAHRREPDAFPWAYLLAIVTDVNGGSPEEVAGRFQAAAERSPSYAPLYFRRGHALALRGELDVAERAHRRALELDPRLAIARRGLGQVLLNQGRIEEARAELELAAEAMPNDGASWSSLAQAYGRLGLDDEAEAAATRSRRLAPLQNLGDPIFARHVTALGVSTTHLLDRAKLQLDLGDARQAIQTLQPILDDGDHPHALYLAGVAWRRLDDADRAAALLERALAVDPQHVGARVELGAIAETRGQLDAALTRYRSALAIEPRDPAALAASARALARSGDDEGAIRAFASLAEVSRLDARSWMNWGNALMRRGDLPGAIERYREALTLDPTYANAHYNLAVALERHGQLDEAIAHYEEAVRHAPGHPAEQALRRLGRR